MKISEYLPLSNLKAYVNKSNLQKIYIFKSMQDNYFILFRDMYIYGKKKQIHGKKCQIQNCGYLCKEGRECDKEGLHGRPQLYLKGFYLLIRGYTNGNITSYSSGVS